MLSGGFHRCRHWKSLILPRVSLSFSIVQGFYLTRDSREGCAGGVLYLPSCPRPQVVVEDRLSSQYLCISEYSRPTIPRSFAGIFRRKLQTHFELSGSNTVFYLSAPLLRQHEGVCKACRFYRFHHQASPCARPWRRCRPRDGPGSIHVATGPSLGC
jgi:hypothetical protein